MESKGKTYHQCTFCDFNTSNKSTLDFHIRAHTKEKPFLCDQCKREYTKKRYLKQHILRVHQGIKEEYKKRNKCSHCPYATYTTVALEAHTQLHHEDLSFPCQHPGCQYTGKSSHYLRKHIAYKHQDKRKYACQFPNCEHRAKTVREMRVHSVKHSEDRPFVCDFEGCSYRAKLKQDLRVHKFGVHHGGHKPFACSFCDYRASSKFLLRSHEVTHMENSVKCCFSGCEFSCKLKKYLDKHVLNCHTEKTFKCGFDGCSSTAASKLKLKQHTIRSHGEKIYKCPSCDYGASYKMAMREHIARRHKARRRIPCPINGCTFLTKNRKDLHKHMRYHKSCPVEGCGYVGHSSSSFKRHKQFHNPTGRPYRCPLCPQYFSRSHIRSSHVQRHTHEKPFKCPECSYTAATEREIRTHVHRTHPNVSSKFDNEFMCDHCNVHFGNAIGFAMHKIELETAVVVLTRLQLQYNN